MKKQILTLTIMLALPFGAWADRIGPIGNKGFSQVDLATDAPYYAKINITNDDKQHVASTAYVKGAYNETIATINRVYSQISENKQGELVNDDTQGNMDQEVLGSESFIYHIDENNDIEQYLVSAQAVVAGINHIVSNKRVEIYTTWDNDNATKEVAFINATPAQSGQ